MGNRLGERCWISYETDQGVDGYVEQDRSVAEGVGNTILQTAPTGQRFPQPGQKLRYILLEQEDGSRKSVVIGDPTNSNFAATSSQEVTIDGVTFFVSGAFGESITFARARPDAVVE